MIESFIQPKYVTDSPPGGPDAGFAAGFAARSVSTASRKHIAAPWIRRKLGAPKVHEFLLNCKSSPDFSRQHDIHCNVTPTVLKTFKKSSKRMMRSGISAPVVAKNKCPFWKCHAVLLIRHQSTHSFAQIAPARCDLRGGHK